MRRTLRFTSVAIVIIAAVTWPALAAASAGATWSQAQGGPEHLGYQADAPVPPFKQSWHLDISLEGSFSTFGVSAPVVSGSTVLTVAPDAIVAADLTSGDQLWTVDRDLGPPVPPGIAVEGRSHLLIYTEGFGDSPPGASPSAPASSPAPAPSSPTGSFDSHLVAIDLATHEPVWKAPIQLKEVSRTGVTVAGDVAYVGDNRGNVYAVDVATGKLRWTVSLGGFLTVPLAATGDVVVATVQASRTVRPRVVALKASDGSQEWSTEVQASAAFATTPVIDGDQVIAGFSDQTIRSFGLADGAQRWVTRINGPLIFTGGLAVAPGAIIAVDSIFGQVYRLDDETGAHVWDFALNRSVLRSPAVVAGGNVLVASGDGRLAAIDLDTGTLVWQSEPTGSTLRSLTPTTDMIVGVEGGVQSGMVGYATDPDGSLVSIDSPTELDAGLLFGAFLAAAIPLAALLILGGRALRARMGPAFLDEEVDALDSAAEPDGEDGTDT